jgi:hypothetical protein
VKTSLKVFYSATALRAYIVIPFAIFIVMGSYLRDLRTPNGLSPGELKSILDGVIRGADVKASEPTVYAKNRDSFTVSAQLHGNDQIENRVPELFKFLTAGGWQSVGDNAYCKGRLRLEYSDEPQNGNRLRFLTLYQHYQGPYKC